MSAENVERGRRWLDGFNARDIDAQLACFDPDIEWHAAFAAIGDDLYRGHEGMRSWHRDLQEAWGDEFRGERELWFDLGEQTLAFAVLHGRGHESGAEVAMPIAAVFTWRDGLIVHSKIYTDRDAALRDLGVSLDDLEPIAP
jgi:ketosteroid isomerase-like protein